MWVSKTDGWNKKTTPLEKFAIERIIQRCDYTEVISNKHRTSNGYTQLKELIRYCELTKRRSRSVNTLISLLKESKSNCVRQNISSDIIISKYFLEFKEYLQEIVEENLLENNRQPKLELLNSISHNLKIFEKQLDAFYFDALKNEFNLIEYSETKKVRRHIKRLSDLIDLLIPYLVFKGYSISTFSEVLRAWIIKKHHITIIKLLKFLDLKKTDYSFLQCFPENNEDTSRYIESLEKQLEIKVNKIKYKDIKKNFKNENSISKNGVNIQYNYSSLDPHNHIRTTFDSVLKDIVFKKERQSLSVFNDYFKYSFWSKSNTPIEKHKKANLKGDSINVSVRGRTLRETLTSISASDKNKFNFDKHDNFPNTKVEELNKAIYYYNLALGSKSIENSLSLLWTSLEVIQPYKISKADILAVQSFISKGLSIGAISRDIFSFASRLIQQNKVNENCLNGIGTKEFNCLESPQGLKDWFDWMRSSSTIKNFDPIKETSELLGFLHLELARPLSEGKQEFLLNRINNSQSSIEFQLVRIYSHRNKIVHSGDFINEYTNLWMHLEWYVGKMLAYFLIDIHFLDNNETLESSFIELDSDYKYLNSYLLKNKDKSIKDLPERIIELLFKHSWQSF